MWMAKRAADRTLPTSPAEVGTVTLTGERLAVQEVGERRNVPLCAPRGVLWKPLIGDAVVLLMTEEGQPPMAVGLSQQEAGDLAPGELRLCSLGATLTLRNDGTVELDGTLKLTKAPVISGGGV